jgi:hypothetical protein
MKDLGNINISRDQIEAGIGNAPKLVHKRKGAVIKLHYAEDMDKYYVEDVIYNEHDYNIISVDKTIYENQSGNSDFDDLIDADTPFKEACEDTHAEWYAYVNGAHYACVLV